MLPYDNCTNCFMPLNGKTVCQNCGNDSSKNKQYPGVLPPFTLLNNRYLVGKVLGKGGFGITYVAKDVIGNNICAVKEYMPSEYSSRSEGTLNVVPYSDDKARYVFTHGREKFMEEAKTLLKLRSNPIVVDILDYFTENNTAYLVMEYLSGQDLRKMARSSGGKIDPEFAKTIFVTIASSLMEVHRMNILHRDLSPENIIVTDDGRIKLIDFGAARNFVSTQNKGMSILLKPGFAPPEQYNTKGNQGPWSDVYALCATFYTLVSGKALVDALFRYRGEQQPSLLSLGCPVTKKTSDVIERGMELDYNKRYKDFKELLDDIDIAASHGPKKQAVQPPVQQQAQQVPQRPPVQPPVQTPVPPVQQPVQTPAPPARLPAQPPAQPPVQTPRPPVQPQGNQRRQPVFVDASPVNKQNQAGGQAYTPPWQRAQQVQRPPVQPVQPVQPVPPVQQPWQQAQQPPQPSNRQKQPPVFVDGTPAGKQNQAGGQAYTPPWQRAQQAQQPAQTPVPPVQPAQPPVQPPKRVNSQSGSAITQCRVSAIVGNSLCNPMPVTTRDILKIGRSVQSCQYIVSGDSNISRIHCYLRFDGKKIYLCDSSSNGTFFEDGTRLAKNSEYVIAPGTKFYLATRNHMFVVNA